MKTYEAGTKLHTIATIKKVKNGIPTVLHIEGRRYVYEPQGSMQMETVKEVHPQ